MNCPTAKNPRANSTQRHYEIPTKDDSEVFAIHGVTLSIAVWNSTNVLPKILEICRGGEIFNIHVYHLTCFV